jgi:hypothetical protein
MAQTPEEFVLRPGTPHPTQAGIVFSLEAHGHKHGSKGLTTGHWTVRYARGDEHGELPFSASAPEDFYGEGLAFGSLFRLLGESQGGVKVALNPQTASPHQSEQAGCKEVLQHQLTFAKDFPPGVSFAQGVSAKAGTGACIFSPVDDSAVVVVGAYSFEVLHARKRKAHQSPPPK